MTTASTLSDWAEQLQTGSYNQGRTYLKTVEERGDNRYCCLGILCELLSLPEDDTVHGEVGFLMPGAFHPQGRLLTGKLASEYGLDKPVTNEEFARLSSLLPDSVSRHTLLAGTLPDRQGFLAILNDRGVPFFAIGMIIKMMGWDNA